MIGHFPEPYPDELFYSLCARFSDRMQYRYPSKVMADLFGNPQAWVIVGLPRYLDHLVAALPPGHPCTVDTLINAHTLLPFYSPFVPPKRLAQVRQQMKGETSGQPGERQHNDCSKPKSQGKRRNPDTRDKYRALWLAAMQDNPDAGTRKLAHANLRVYIWLWYYDCEWLDSHKPLPRKRKGVPTGPRLDWAERDTQLAEQVRQSALRLVTLPGRPIQVTKRAIGRDLAKVNLVKNKSAKLPLTAQALSEVTESYEAFTVRRIQWAADNYRLEGHSPTRTQLLTRAGVASGSLTHRGEKAIELALEMLGAHR